VYVCGSTHGPVSTFNEHAMWSVVIQSPRRDEPHLSVNSTVVCHCQVQPTVLCTQYHQPCFNSLPLLLSFVTAGSKDPVG